MTTLPRNLVLSLVADLLAARAQRLRNRAERSPHAAKASVSAGRKLDADRLMGRVRHLQAMRAEGDVSAETAGLLLAWASGYADALVELEAIGPSLENIAGYDYVAACRLLLGPREGR